MARGKYLGTLFKHGKTIKNIPKEEAHINPGTIVRPEPPATKRSFPLATTVFATVSIYNLSELYKQHKHFEHKIGHPFPDVPVPDITLVPLESEDMLVLVFGRQSPGEGISEGASFKFPMIGTVRADGRTEIINEGKEDFLADLDYKYTPLGLKQCIAIKSRNMDPTDHQNLDQNKKYVVGVGVKNAFAGLAGEASHAAIILREYKPGMDVKDCVLMSGKEVKQIMEKTNDEICKTQKIDMITSNCYSAMMVWLVNAAELIESRKRNNPKDTEDIKVIYNAVTYYSHHNLGLGIINNELVTNKCTKELPNIVKNKGLQLPTGLAAGLEEKPTASGIVQRKL